MVEATGYHKIAIDMIRELVNHGWGEMTVRVNSSNDNSCTVIVTAGRSYIFKIRKDINLDKYNLL